MNERYLRNSETRYTPAARYPAGTCSHTSRRTWRRFSKPASLGACVLSLLMAAIQGGCTMVRPHVYRVDIFNSQANAEKTGSAAIKPLDAGDLDWRPRASGMSEAELAIWNHPEFKKRFMDSYAAVTDIEPRVGDADREQLSAVTDLMGAEKLDEAMGLLLAQTSNPKCNALFDFLLANVYFQKSFAAGPAGVSADANSPAASSVAASQPAGAAKPATVKAAEGELLARSAKAARAAIAKESRFRRAYGLLAQVQLRQGRFAEALPMLTRVIELGGGDKLTYGSLGFAYSSVGQDLAAESAYRTAILLDPNTVDWKMGFVSAVARQERYPEAVALFGQLIEASPGRSDLWLYQANAYLGMNRPAKAAENLEMIDRLGNSTPETLNLLGDIYITQELYAMAVDRYSRAMAASPEAGYDRALKAARVLAARNALVEAGQLADKVESLAGSAVKDSDRKEILRLRARIAVANGSAGDDVKILEQIVKLDPTDGEALILLGQNSAKAGDHEKAIYYFERAEALDQYECDAKVQHAVSLVKQNKYSQALPLLRSSLEKKPRQDVQEYLDQVERLAKAAKGS